MSRMKLQCIISSMEQSKKEHLFGALLEKAWQQARNLPAVGSEMLQSSQRIWQILKNGSGNDMNTPLKHNRKEEA